MYSCMIPPPGVAVFQCRLRDRNRRSRWSGIRSPLGEWIEQYWWFLTLDSHKDRMIENKSPKKTLNKRSFWESLFRPRTRPSKCAIPYFKVPNFFNFWRKLTPNVPIKCTKPDADAAACCTEPTTLANPGLAPKRFWVTLIFAGAFAATCAVNAQLPCRYDFWADAFTLPWP